MCVTVVCRSGAGHGCVAPGVSFSDGFVLIIRLSMAGALLALAPSPAAAEATVGEVIAACQRAAAADGQGVDAAYCDWYALPCACKIAPEAVEAPRWCYPQPLDEAAALAAVLAELTAVPGSVPAASAVPQILSRLYPCDASAP